MAAKTAKEDVKNSMFLGLTKKPHEAFLFLLTMIKYTYEI